MTKLMVRADSVKKEQGHRILDIVHDPFASHTPSEVAAPVPPPQPEPKDVAKTLQDPLVGIQTLRTTAMSPSTSSVRRDVRGRHASPAQAGERNTKTYLPEELPPRIRRPDGSYEVIKQEPENWPSPKERQARSAQSREDYHARKNQIADMHDEEKGRKSIQEQAYQNAEPMRQREAVQTAAAHYSKRPGSEYRGIGRETVSEEKSDTTKKSYDVEHRTTGRKGQLIEHGPQTSHVLWEDNTTEDVPTDQLHIMQKQDPDLVAKGIGERIGGKLEHAAAHITGREHQHLTLPTGEKATGYPIKQKADVAKMNSRDATMRAREWIERGDDPYQTGGPAEELVESLGMEGHSDAEANDQAERIMSDLERKFGGKRKMDPALHDEIMKAITEEMKTHQPGRQVAYEGQQLDRERAAKMQRLNEEAAQRKAHETVRQADADRYPKDLHDEEKAHEPLETDSGSMYYSLRQQGLSDKGAKEYIGGQEPSDPGDQQTLADIRAGKGRLKGEQPPMGEQVITPKGREKADDKVWDPMHQRYLTDSEAKEYWESVAARDADIEARKKPKTEEKAAKPKVPTYSTEEAWQHAKHDPPNVYDQPKEHYPAYEAWKRTQKGDVPSYDDWVKSDASQLYIEIHKELQEQMKAQQHTSEDFPEKRVGYYQCPECGAKFTAGLGTGPPGKSVCPECGEIVKPSTARMERYNR